MDDLIVMDFFLRMKEGMEVGWRKFAAGKKGRKKGSARSWRGHRARTKGVSFWRLATAGAISKVPTVEPECWPRECCLHSTYGLGEDSDVSGWEPARTAIDWPQEHPELSTQAETVSYP